MKHIVFAMIAVLCFCNTLKAEEKNHTQNKEETMKMEIMRKGTQKSFKGPEDMFTGDVQVDMLFPSNETAHYSGAYVTFQPGARTAWHLHPAGQHMIVTSGVGLTGTRDGKIVTMKTGDTVWCPPDIDHWHGATPDSPMTHLVVTGELDGKNVVWKEKVTDEQYSYF
jgi:4-carboxymuconolactone decarboxylase